MRILSLPILLLLLLPAFEVAASGRRPDPSTISSDSTASRGVTLKDFARAHGFRTVKSEKDHFRLSGEVHTLLLYRGSRRAVLNGTLVWLSEPLLPRGKEWWIDEKDVRFTLQPVLRPASVLANEGTRIVVLDPGHGGQDSGARSPDGLEEKEVVLDISRRVRALLQPRGIRVLLTRHDDRFLELEERPRRADRWDADLFVSIHANSGRSSAQGVETFVLSLPGSLSTNQNAGTPAPTVSHPGNLHNATNMALAYSLHHSLRMLPQTQDRGVKRARFAVLRTATAPAALVEMGFLSHPVEGKRFRDPDHRERVARSIARGIDNYLQAVKTAHVNQELNSEED